MIRAGIPFAGIGSRESGAAVCGYMAAAARVLARKGYVLRSGGAAGADTAFANGCREAGGQMEIYLPRNGFRQAVDGAFVPDASAFAWAEEIASQHHPVWSELTKDERALMTRNVFQILGTDGSCPSRFVICWTPRCTFDSAGRISDVSGGTGLAVRLAYSRGIPVFHLGHEAHARRILAMTEGEPLTRSAAVRQADLFM